MRWLALLALLACAPETEEGYVYRKTKYLYYFKDPHTGVCFAENGYHGGIATVPCEAVPDSLLNRSDR